MQEKILKSDWERSHHLVEIDIDIAQELLTPHTRDAIHTLTLLSDGCANSNYKVTLQNGRSVVLRIYQREPSSLLREANIHNLVRSVIPVANFLHVDNSCLEYPFPYAILEWKDGILMRDFLFTANEAAISAAMFDAGQHLNTLRRMKLPIGGIFTDDMHIRPFDDTEGDYQSFVIQLLEDSTVKASLGNNLHHDVHDLVSKCSDLFPLINDANLTHGDFDPANMLVQEVKGEWKIAAILDWEFAHAGTYLTDIGLMLRYSHKLPAEFETNFIRGIEDAGMPLPTDWKTQSQLMNLLCLLQLLHANPATERPYMNRDIVRLITHMVKTLPTLRTAR